MLVPALAFLFSELLALLVSWCRLATVAKLSGPSSTVATLGVLAAGAAQCLQPPGAPKALSQVLSWLLALA